MSTENTPVETVTDDLDAFSEQLYGQSKSEPEAATSEDTDVEEQEVDATETKTQDDDADAVETETDDDADTVEEEDDNDPEPDVKPKKNRFQERIDELTGKAKNAEREAEELRRRLEAIEQKQNPKDEPTPAPADVSGPSADDKNEDGSDKYPLGEFDPQYIRDLTRHTLQQEREAEKQRESAAKQEQEYAAERAALTESWQEKLGPAQERYPDFQEKGAELFTTFNGIDQTYGEYLTATLMSMDHGPDVLYYLASNLDEANNIVASGPTKATIALGRLEAKFVQEAAEKTLARPKVSKAPTPPTTLKGSNQVVADVPDDTDDLEAFAKKLFKKK
jgi:hypothetical protein